MSDVEYAVIGGGAIGRSIALALGQRGHEEVVVIDKCARDRIENQSTRNSGVVHAGVYYQQGERPLKARLCVLGNAMLYTFCRTHDVPHVRTGKLIVATSGAEEAALQSLYSRALENQVPEPALLSAQEARTLEPKVVATAALHLPSSGVVDAAGYLSALTRACPADTLWGTEVTGIRKCPQGFELRTRCGSREELFVARTVINAAGLHADEIAKMIDPESPYAITPVRGESAKFYKTRRADLAMTGMNVYPLPRSFTAVDGRRIETLGVHLTPTLDGEGSLGKTVTIGPAVQTAHKDDFASNLYPPSYYWQQVHKFFPGLREDDIELHQTGIQARFSDQPDWVIESASHEARFINLIGIDSPGLTASLAIASYVLDELVPD